MSIERKLIDYVNDAYAELDFVPTKEQKMFYETGVAKGITFALTQLINPNIDLTVLADYENMED